MEHIEFTETTKQSKSTQEPDVIEACETEYPQDMQAYILSPLTGELFKNFDKNTRENLIALSNEMKNGGDPSFECVSSVFPHYMDFPKAITGVKEHHGRFLSSWDGSIIYPPMYLSFEVEQPGQFVEHLRECTPFSHTDVKKTDHSLLDGYLPVIIRNFEYDEIAYEQTIFGWSREFSTDSRLIAFVRIRAENLSQQEKHPLLALSFRGTAGRPAWQKWTTCWSKVIHCPRELRQQGSLIIDENNDVVCRSDRDDGIFGNNKFALPLSLCPAQETELYFCIPYESATRDEVPPASKENFEETLAKVRTFWEGVSQRGTQITVPEQIINAAYKTWHFNDFLLVQENRDHQSYKTNDAPFYYEGVFGYAAAMYLNTLTTGGYFEEAQKCANMFVGLQRQDGGLTGVNRANDIVPHQHGAILYTISQLYRMSRDKAWFETVIPNIIRGCNWVINERRESLKVNDEITPATFGLLPPHRYHVDGGTGAIEYVGNVWCWAGLAQVAVALKELGDAYAEQSARFSEEANRYRDDILNSMKKTAIQQEDVTFLPIALDDKPFKNILDVSSHVGYMASRMLESEIFDVDDERIHWIPDFFEKCNGIILGVTHRNLPDNLAYSAHFAAGYGLNHLRMNKIDKFLLTYYGMLSYGMARKLFSTQEHDAFQSDINIPWSLARQPHLHSTAELIRLTNQMLVKEERGGIWLAWGTPRKWLNDGETIDVKDSHTCYGKFDLRIESAVSNGAITAYVGYTSNGITPAAVSLKLRHPQKTPIARVRINGTDWNDFGQEAITLPAVSGEYAICVEY